MTPHSELPHPAQAARVADDLVVRLRGTGRRHEDATRELHTMLLRAARYELRRRAAALANVRGEDAEDLALQAADDAFVAVMAKLDQFRGESRFSTWAYKFALYEAAVRVRRRAWQDREVVIDHERWVLVEAQHAGPDRHAGQSELLDDIRRLIETRLTVRQRDVLVSLAIEGVPIDVLAERLGSSRGALYKSLHDARRRLRSELVAAGHDLDSIAP